jgi:MSHA biogenesis protein MshJ
MNDRVQALLAKLDALSTRERAMVGFAGVAVIGFVLWAVLVDPTRVANRAARARVADAQAEIERLATQRRPLIEKLAEPPEVLQRRELARLDEAVRQLDERVQAMSRGLVPAARMAETMRGLLGRTPGLELVAMRTEPARPLIEPAASAPDAAPAAAASTSPATARPGSPAVGIWKHGLAIELEGRFPDLAASVARLDTLPVRVLWSDTHLRTLEWPRVRMTLTVYTLSLDDAWMLL